MIVQCDKSLHSKTIHPLINIGCLSDISNTFIETGFYRIILKDRSSCPDFGRLCCDYQDASVIFLSPEYSLSCLTSEDLSFYKKSIFLSFHADLINTSAIKKHFNDYYFFNYRQNESLHISLREKKILTTRFDDISDELNWGIDKYTNILISGKIELLLNYCKRFYTRQFITRSEVNRCIIQKTKRLIDEYFFMNKISEKGLPTSDYCSNNLNLSSAYFEDLFNHETGMSIAEYIQLRRVHLAKERLCNTNKTVSCIARELGYPSQQYFCKLFKKLSGYTPDEYRNPCRTIS